METQVFNMAQAQVLEAQVAASKAKFDQSTSALQSANKTALRQAAEDFEAVFLSQMLKPMFDTIPTDSMMSGGNGEDIYRGMMVEQMGKSISRNGGVGIADSVYRELLKLQEQ